MRSGNDTSAEGRFAPSPHIAWVAFNEPDEPNKDARRGVTGLMGMCIYKLKYGLVSKSVGLMKVDMRVALTINQG